MKRLAGLVALALFLVGLIGTAHSESINGPRRWKKVLKANSIVEYKIDYRAPTNPGRPQRKEAAEFVVVGDGSTDVDIHVLEANGQPLRDDKGQAVMDIFDTDIARVVWFPKKTGTYIIRVTNLGNADNECYMGHN